ncbi:MAG: 50S ribosomal protein L9 [Minisyncoccota bacterium]
MKIILIKDVKGMGRAHEEVTTSDGYALNYLIPKKLAIVATPVAKQEAETRRKQVVDRGALDVALLTQSLASLAEARIVIKMKANEKGHLYDAVGESDILKAVKEQSHIDLPEEVIKLEKPIKELGTFDIPVASADTFGKFSIIIEAE